MSVHEPRSFAHRFEPGSGSAEDTLLLLHGTGGNENDLLPLGRAIAPGASLLSPRGLVLEHGMPRFFRRIAEGVFDLPDLHARTTQLAEFITTAAAEYGFDSTRVHAVGFSNGANIAASLLFSYPAALASAILLRPMVPFEPEPLPILTGRSVLIAAGREDPIVPHEHGERLAGLLRRAGADVEVTRSGADHGLARGDLDACVAWWAARHP
ncbi:MAG: alpha/beta hydrolase [Candidatus Eisenbacteria bacterium]